MSGLPKGWVEILLTDLASPEKYSIVDGPFGSDLKLSDYVADGTVPVLSTKNLTDYYDPHSVRFISEKKFQQLKRSKINGGDILVAKIGSIGKCSIYPSDAPTAIIPANLCKITVDNNIVSNRYLFWQIRSDQFQNKLKDITSATAQPAFSVQRLKTLSINLAPLNEQYRIVSQLEELLAKVDACQTRLAKIPVILKRFRQAVLAAACSGRLTADWRDERTLPLSPSHKGRGKKRESAAAPQSPSPLVGEGRGEGEELPEGWRHEISRALLSFVTSGSRGWARYYSTEGPLFIRIGNLNHDSISLDFRNIQCVHPPESAEGKRTRVRSNDILISITADVGMIALAPNDIEEAYINQHIALARPTKDVYPRYLAWYLATTEGGLKQFQELQRGATKVGLGLEDIKSILVPVPSLLEQQEIVRRVEALFTLADQLEARYQKAKTHVDRLTQSILFKAFRGELVPQDENDEPASVLLERIRAQRSTPALEKRTVVPMRPKKQKFTEEPEPLPLAAEPPVIYAATIPQRILAIMKHGKEYTRAEIIAESGISDAEWVWAIRQLKEEGHIRQTGEKRGARYGRK